MTETPINVGGMSCPSCIRHIDGALKRLGGVSNVDVRLREGRVVVRHDATIAAAALTEAIRDAGYDASPAT